MDSDFKNAISAILRPLIRHMIEGGWTYPQMSEMLKEIYVAEALQQDTDGGQRITDSRVSLLTGIHRKDVKRLRSIPPTETNTSTLSRNASLAARVVAEWISTRRYLDSQGMPKALAVRDTGRGPSFETLVKKVKADMRPVVVLDELLRANVAKLAEDKVHLLRRAYIPDLPRDKLAYLGANVGDHLQSALHNIKGKDDPFLERAVYYNLMDAEGLRLIQPELISRAERFLTEINQLVMPLNTDAIEQRTQNGRRMRLGIYYFEDDSPPVSTQEKTVNQASKRNEA